MKYQASVTDLFKLAKPPETLNLLFYGLQKTGKTTAALTAPRPLAIIDTEGGSLAYADAKDYDGKVKVGKVNVDNEIKTANEFTIQNIPTIIIFKDGKEVERIIGAVPKNHIVKKLKKYI